MIFLSSYNFGTQQSPQIQSLQMYSQPGMNLKSASVWASWSERQLTATAAKNQAINQNTCGAIKQYFFARLIWMPESSLFL